MAQYIDKSALVAEIEKNKNEMEPERDWHFDEYTNGYLDALKEVLSFINTLEVKEINSNNGFIEKACEWLEPVLKNYAGYYVGKDILEDFKNYMEGE